VVDSNLGRFDRNYRQLVWVDAFGSNTDPATVAVVFIKETFGLTASTWNPSVTRPCRLVGGSMTSVCGADVTPGDWNVDFHLNESATVLASASYPCTTSLNGTRLDWDKQVFCEAGDRWFIEADGPSKSTVILRATLEFELL